VATVVEEAAPTGEEETEDVSEEENNSIGELRFQTNVVLPGANELATRTKIIQRTNQTFCCRVIAKGNGVEGVPRSDDSVRSSLQCRFVSLQFFFKKEKRLAQFHIHCVHIGWDACALVELLIPFARVIEFKDVTHNRAPGQRD
jgi:hypothetical protein